MARVYIHMLAAVAAALLWLLPVDFAVAHHVLGRPAYSLSEDSNTPPSIQAEVQIGDFFVTYMVFPAFPEPDKPGRLNLYISRIDDGTPYDGTVTFHVRDEPWAPWLQGDSEVLGRQPSDDNVYRQGFLFAEAGDYIVTAAFEAGDGPYTIDFPLRIGEPPLVGPFDIAVGALLIVLVTITAIQGRRAMSGKIRGAHENRDEA